jgi:ABC-type multidrug transport system ATPase subunit
MAGCLGPGSIRTRRCRGSRERIGLALAESQVAAIRLALMSKVLVMTGGPGVGKTTIVNAILQILAAKGVRLLLCAVDLELQEFVDQLGGSIGPAFRPTILDRKITTFEPAKLMQAIHESLG